MVQTDSVARQSTAQKRLQLGGNMALGLFGSLCCKHSLSYSCISCCNSCNFPVPIACNMTQNDKLIGSAAKFLAAPAAAPAAGYYFTMNCCSCIRQLPARHSGLSVAVASSFCSPLTSSQHKVPSTSEHRPAAGAPVPHSGEACIFFRRMGRHQSLHYFHRLTEGPAGRFSHAGCMWCSHCVLCSSMCRSVHTAG